jgi:hypothetical protein
VQYIGKIEWIEFDIVSCTSRVYGSIPMEDKNSISKRGGEDREVTVNSLELKIIGAP